MFHSQMASYITKFNYLWVFFRSKQQSNRVPEWKKRMQNLEKEAKGTNIVGGAVDKIAARI